MKLDPLMEEDDEDELESHCNDEEEVIQQFLESDRHGDGTSSQFIFSFWQVAEADDADEEHDAAEAGATAEDGDSVEARRGDDGDAQSMTVPQHASRDDNDDAQSMTVPQHSSPEEDDAQSMTVPQHARRRPAAEMDMEMENLEREMLEAESEEEEMLGPERKEEEMLEGESPSEAKSSLEAVYGSLESSGRWEQNA